MSLGERAKKAGKSKVNEISEVDEIVADLEASKSARRPAWAGDLTDEQWSQLQRIREGYGRLKAFGPQSVLRAANARYKFGWTEERIRSSAARAWLCRGASE